jgi:YVTN family beta-propeller protein
VANTASDTVSVIDSGTNTVTATINVGTSPGAIAVDPTTDSIYVANGLDASPTAADGTVSVIDGGTNTVTTTITVGKAPDGIAVDPTTNTIYVADSLGIVSDLSGAISVVNGATDEVSATITDEFIVQPAGVGVDASTDTVYIAGSGADSVVPIDGAGNTVGTQANLTSEPNGIAVDSSTDTVYATENDGDLAIIDGSTSSVTATVGVGTSPAGVAVDPTTDTLYVANEGSSSISVIDGSTDAVTNAVAVPSGPESVLHAGSDVYVTQTGASSQAVSVLDGPEAPSAPALASSSAGNDEVSLTWSAPADGESAIASYVIAAAPTNGLKGVVESVGASERSGAVAGLKDGTAYYVTVTAENAIGTGSASVPVSLMPAGPPSVAFGVVARPGDKSATVSWKPPASDEGSPITLYDVIAYIGSTAQKPVPVSPSKTSKTVSGLKNGTAYTFVVTATNKVGTSRSKPSATVTPATVPGPAVLKGTAGDKSVSLTWRPPAPTGGAPIKGYDVYVGTSPTAISTKPANMSVIGRSVTSYKVTGLKNGTAYYFILKAVNEMGVGASSNVVKLTPEP